MLSTPKYIGAVPAVSPLALGYVAYASTQITAVSISLKKKTIYFTVFSWVAGILNIILNLLFIPQFGLLATAWSTAISYIALTIGYALVSQRLWPIQYETRRVTVTVILTLAFSVAAPLLPQMDILLGVVVKSVYCLLYAGLLWGLGAIDSREWDELVQMIPRKQGAQS